MTTEIKQFDKLAAEIQTFVVPALKVSVTTPESCQDAQEFASKVKKLQKSVENHRKLLVEPHLEAQRSINAYVKQILEPLAKVESHLKSNLIAWERKLQSDRERDRKEAEAKIAAERKAEAEKLKAVEAEAEAKAKLEAEADSMFGGSAEAPEAPAEPSIEDQQKQAEIERQAFLREEKRKSDLKRIEENRVKGVQKVWTFEVTDPSKVPEKYKVVDEKLIRAAVKSGEREIAGVRIFEETKIAIRS